MYVLLTNKDKEIEQPIKNVLLLSNIPQKASTVILDVLKEDQTINNHLVREAIWRLIARHEIELNTDLRISLLSK